MPFEMPFELAFELAFLIAFLMPLVVASLVAFLLASLSVVFGPDPTPEQYHEAHERPERTAISQDFVSQPGFRAWDIGLPCALPADLTPRPARLIII